MLKLDAGGNVTEVSINIQKQTGFSENELVGKPIFDFLKPLSGSQDLDHLREIFQSNPSDGFQFQFYFSEKRGEEIIFKLNGVAILNRQNQTKSFIIAVENITESFRYRQSLEAKNKQITDLAFEQSHLVRAPLARILAITYFLQDPDILTLEQKEEQIRQLKLSSDELDLHIRNISEKMKV